MAEPITVNFVNETKSAKWHLKRVRIMTAASRLFWKKGFVAASLDDVAKSCRLNKAGLYYYFTNKTTLLFEIIAWAMEELTKLAVPIAESDLSPDEKLRKLVYSHVVWGLSNMGPSGLGALERRNLPPKLLKSYIAMRDDYELIFRKVIKKGIEDGCFRQTDYKLVTNFILGLTVSTVLWYKQRGKLNPEEIAGEALRFVDEALKKH